MKLLSLSLLAFMLINIISIASNTTEVIAATSISLNKPWTNDVDIYKMTDNNQSTAYTPESKYAIAVFELNSSVTVTKLKILWTNAASQQTIFEIRVFDTNPYNATDGTMNLGNTCEASNIISSKTFRYQDFNITNLKAGKFVALIGRYNLSQDWSNISIAGVKLLNSSGIELIPKTIKGYAFNTTQNKYIEQDASALTDSNDTTIWSGNSVVPEVTIDLGQSQYVDRLSIDWYQSNQQQMTYDMFTSADGVVYSNITGDSDNSFLKNELVLGYQNQAIKQTCRFIKIRTYGQTSLNWSRYCSYNELKVENNAIVVTPTPTAPAKDPAYYETTPRPVTNRNPLVATTCVRFFLGNKTATLTEIKRVVDKTAEGVKTGEGRYPDIIVLSEMLYTRGFAPSPEVIPGTLSNTLAMKCKQYNTYIAYNFLEQCYDGKMRNCEVLIDRDGLIVGKYYKYKIPPEEIAYTTAGTEFNVFQTEFGNVGMMVCYDLDAKFNGQVAKGLKANGAELVFASSFGEYAIDAKRDTTENHMAIVIAGQDKYRSDSTEPISSIYNSNGVRLAGVTDRTALGNNYNYDGGSFAYAYVDLGPYVTATATATATPTATATAQATATATPLPTRTTPTDIEGNWAIDSINRLYNMGIVNGYNDGYTVLIKPDEMISRAEMAVVIVNALELNPTTDAQLSFADADSIPVWAKGYIETACQNGIVLGYEDNTFRADNLIQRCEIVAMVMRALGFGTNSYTETNYEDNAQIPIWAKSYTAKATELGIIDGYNIDGKLSFKAEYNATRAEAFKIIDKMIGS